MDAQRHIEGLNQIVSEDVRAAYIHLLVEAERSGLTTSSNSGHVFSVRMHDQSGRYLFSYIANQHHLLFYLRLPALQMSPELPSSAERQGFKIARNPAGEATIRLESLENARDLAEWLFAQVPLS